MYRQAPLMLAAYKGRIEAVKMLVEAKGIDLTTVNKNGDGLVAVVRKNYGGRTGSEAVFEELMDHLVGAGLEGGDEPSDEIKFESPGLGRGLLQACQEGLVSDVRQLLSQGADVNHTVELGSALTIALARGHIDVARELLKHPYIDVNFANRRGMTALHCAVAGGHTDIVRLLCRHPRLSPSCLNMRDAEQLVSPLMLAVVRGEVAAARELAMSSTVAWDTVDRAGRGLQQALAAARHSESVRRELATLLGGRGGQQANGCEGLLKVEVPTSRPGGPRASPTGSPGIPRFSKEHQAKLLVNNRFWEACRTGEVERAWECLQQGATVTWVPAAEAAGRNGLMAAIQGGHARLVDLLMAVPNVDLDHIDFGGRTVLHYAVAGDQPQLLARLVGDPRLAAATLDRREAERQHSALMLAAWRGRPDMVRLLLAGHSVGEGLGRQLLSLTKEGRQVDR
jgi:ankyrin repeat protein